MVACGSLDPAPSTATPQGASAQFGAAALPLTTAPGLQFASPAEGQYFYVDYAAPVPVSVNLALDVTNFVLGPNAGQIICHINGKGPAIKSTTPTIKNVDLGTAKGVRVISCSLANWPEFLLPGLGATANLHVYISQDPVATDSANTCTTESDCADSQGCSMSECVAGKCKYKYKSAAIPQCCSSSYECPAGHVCAGTGLAATCSLCKANSECSDDNPCTIDSCNTETGLCNFTFNGDPKCCKVSADCDDADPLTADLCDPSNTCTYKPVSDAGSLDAAIDAAPEGDSGPAEDAGGGDLGADGTVDVAQPGDTSAFVDTSTPPDSALDAATGPDAAPSGPDGLPSTDTAHAGTDAVGETAAAADGGVCDAKDGCALAPLDACASDSKACHPPSSAQPGGPADRGCASTSGQPRAGAAACLLFAAAAVQLARRGRWKRSSAG